MDSVTHPPWNHQTIDGFADFCEQQIKQKYKPPFKSWMYTHMFNKYTNYKTHNNRLFRDTFERLKLRGMFREKSEEVSG